MWCPLINFTTRLEASRSHGPGLHGRLWRTWEAKDLCKCTSIKSFAPIFDQTAIMIIFYLCSRSSIKISLSCHPERCWLAPAPCLGLASGHHRVLRRSKSATCHRRRMETKKCVVEPTSGLRRQPRCLIDPWWPLATAVAAYFIIWPQQCHNEAVNDFTATLHKRSSPETEPDQIQYLMRELPERYKVTTTDQQWEILCVQ